MDFRLKFVWREMLNFGTVKKRASMLVLKHYGIHMYNLYIFNMESLVASEYKVFTFEIKEFEAFSKTSYRQASSQSPVL
jgi:hypothetical protein